MLDVATASELDLHYTMPAWAHALVLGALAFAGHVQAIGQDTCVAFKSSSANFPLVSNHKATPILLSADEWPGVQRTAFDFASDIQQVTGVKPTLKNATSARSSYSSLGSTVVIVGTLGKSSLVDEVVNRTKLDVSSIEGKWEAFLAKEVANPLPGIDSAYVIIGADKRGTIFALYDHSEQFGAFRARVQSAISAHFVLTCRRLAVVLVRRHTRLRYCSGLLTRTRWADVPTTQHTELFVTSSGCSHGSPTVKYRAIFLNDEQPALQNWALEKFTNGTGAALTGSPFNHFFYAKL